MTSWTQRLETQILVSNSNLRPEIPGKYLQYHSEGDVNLLNLNEPRALSFSHSKSFFKTFFDFQTTKSPKRCQPHSRIMTSAGCCSVRLWLWTWIYSDLAPRGFQILQEVIRWLCFLVRYKFGCFSDGRCEFRAKESFIFEDFRSVLRFPSPLRIKYGFGA